MIASLEVLKVSALGCLGLAVGAASLLCASVRHAWWMRSYERYVAHLQRRMRLLFIEVPASRIVVGQGIAGSVVLATSLLVGTPWLCVLLLAVAAGPSFQLERMRQERVARIEAQLHGFVSALANALRATPSPGRALALAHGVTPAPLDREVELVLREMRVGSTLEEALSHMCARVESFPLDAAISGLLIGRQTGGDVPRILDSTAHTLREMARLSGVLRAKTADGRAQAKVLALFPLGLIFAFDHLSPGYFTPLTETPAGLAVTAVAIGLWLGSVVLVRRIMEVKL